MIPTWLHLLSIASLLLGTLCLADAAADGARYPQHLGIMNVVWPVTALAYPVNWWLIRSGVKEEM